MELMTAEEWLKCVLKLYQYKVYLEGEIKKRREDVQNPKTLNYGSDANGNIKIVKKSDRTGDGVASLCDILPPLQNKYDVASNKYALAYDALSQCYEEPGTEMKIEEFEVLVHIYFENMTVWEVMQGMNYSKTSVYRYKIEGIKHLNEFMQNGNSELFGTFWDTLEL